jgi:hypothetical protein
MEKIQKIADILHLCGETHHTVYKKVEGNDPEWALWYAEWLMTLSDLPELIPNMKTESELAYMLVKLDKEYTENKPEEKWPMYYAKVLSENY